MSWLRIGDEMVNHPKVIDLSDKAFRLFFRLISWASFYKTDGAIKASIAKKFSNQKTITELVNAGLLDKGHDSYSIHDYLDYNPSKTDDDSLEKKRAARVEAGRIGGLRSAESRKAAAEEALFSSTESEVCFKQPGGLLEANSKQTSSKFQANFKQIPSPVPHPLPHIAPSEHIERAHEADSGLGLSKQTFGKLSPTWTPDELVLGSVEMAGIPRAYALEVVPAFVAYHCAGGKQASALKWGQAFVSWCNGDKQNGTIDRWRKKSDPDSAVRSIRGPMPTGQSQTEGSRLNALRSLIEAKVHTWLQLSGWQGPSEERERLIMSHSDRLEKSGWNGEGEPTGLDYLLTGKAVAQ